MGLWRLPSACLMQDMLILDKCDRESLLCPAPPPINLFQVKGKWHPGSFHWICQKPSREVKTPLCSPDFPPLSPGDYSSFSRRLKTKCFQVHYCPILVLANTSTVFNSLVSGSPVSSFGFNVFSLISPRNLKQATNSNNNWVTIMTQGTQ